MKTIHTKKSLKTDLRYARRYIAQIESAMKNDNWQDVEDASEELSALFSSLASRAVDNKEDIEDFNCKYQDEIDEIRAQRAKQDVIEIECNECGNYSEDVDNVGWAEFSAQARDAGWLVTKSKSICDECRTDNFLRPVSPIPTYTI